MGVPSWARTPAQNATADSQVAAQDGASARSFPPSLRAVMAAARRLADDQGGALVTTGDLNAYRVSTGSGLTELRAGIRLLTKIHRTNTAEATLNADGLGPLPWVDAGGIPLKEGRLIESRFYESILDTLADGSAVAWRVQAGASTLDEIPGLTQARDTAAAAAATATTKAGEANASAGTASAKAGEAQTAAATATTKASEAQTAASTATTKAGEANTAATNAAAQVPLAAAETAKAAAQAQTAQAAVTSGRVSQADKAALDAVVGNYPDGAVGVARTGTGAGEYARVGGVWSYTGPTTATLDLRAGSIEAAILPLPGRISANEAFDARGRDLAKLERAFQLDTALDTRLPLIGTPKAEGTLPLEELDLSTGTHLFYNDLGGEGFLASVLRVLRARLGSTAETFLYDTTSSDRIPVGVAFRRPDGDLFAPFEIDPALGAGLVNGVDPDCAARAGSRYSLFYRQAGGLQQVWSRRASDLKETALTATGDNAEAVLSNDQKAVSFVRTLNGARQELWVSPEGGETNFVDPIRHLVAVGDSLTVASSVAFEDQWVTKVAQFLYGATDASVQTRVCQGGRTAQQQAAVLGARPATVAISGGQIPADRSSVTLTFSPDLDSNNVHTQTYKGTILGVPGVLSFNNGAKVYSFVRDVAGAAVPVPDGTLFVPTFTANVKNALLITRLGTNGFTDPIGSADAIQSMIDWNRALNKKILITSAVNRVDYTAANNPTFYQYFIVLNAEYKRRWPQYYVETRIPPTDEEMAAIGYVPTDQDRIDIANDTIPGGMRVDGLHENAAGQALYALRINRALQAKGWV